MTHTSPLPPPPSMPPVASGADAAPASRWVPIHQLGPQHAGAIQTHLLAQDDRDRYLRFGYLATDEQIGRYVASLDFKRDEVFGIFNRGLRLIGLAHLAFTPDAGKDGVGAEFGGSVLKQVRGQGHGAHLFAHALLHARNKGVSTLTIHALSENAPMLHIARRAGATVVRDGSESDAYLRLPPDTLASQTEQWVGDSAASIDYHIKHQARRVDALLDAIGEVKSRMGKGGSTASG